MLWMSAGYGADLSTPERRAAFEQSLRSAVASIGNPDVRRHYEIAVRERLERHLGATRRPAPRGSAQRRAWGRPPRFAAPPSGPSASLLAHPLVRESGRGAGPSRSEAILIGVLVQHPGIAVDRLETFADAQFSGRGLAALAAALAAKLADSPGIAVADLRAALERDGHGEALAGVLEKLRSIGLGSLADADEERAAAVWDEAAHLRLRAGALSIERQAAAAAFAQEANEINLSRLRDIQEQDQRSLRPDRHEEAEAAIVHPFKRR
jgi:DNA primase